MRRYNPNWAISFRFQGGPVPPPCGPGYYGMYSRGEVWNDGAWRGHGNAIWSGSTYWS